MKDSKIINSFVLQKTLNPNVWDNYDNVDKASIKPKIRENLLRAAQEFLYYIDLDIIVEEDE